MATDTEQRLSRIEEKIDRLADAMIALARAEEKIAAISEAQNNQNERLNRLSQKIDEITEQTSDNKRTVQVINRLFWVAIVAAAGAIASNMWM